jgi:hypothetical protein
MVIYNKKMPVPPNKIKYTTTKVDNTIKAKNFALGINAGIDYGPTSTTGFWNGITPTVSGYTIYINKAVQGPSIFYPANDSALINFTNYISGNTFTTLTQATAWYAGQTEIICVNSDYPDVVTNGLRLMVDSGFLPSYCGSGTTWTDLSYSGFNATLINSPSYVLSGKSSYLNFSSSSSNYATFSDLGNLSNFSCEVWTKQNSLPALNSFPAFITNPGPLGSYINYAIGYTFAPWDGKIYGGFFNGSWQLPSSGFTPTTDQWYHYAVTYDGSKVVFYVDGKYYSSGSTSTAALSSGAGGNLMKRWDDTNYIDGFLLNAKVYNRALSSNEILQNYNAHAIPIGVTTDGLILNLDADNVLSYPYTGTLWKSTVSSVQNNGTLTNGPTFNLSNGGSLVFDGTNDYVSLPSNFFNPDAGTPFSVSIWFKTTTAGGTLFGQQNTSNPSSASGYVPAIYINSSGQIVTSCFWGGSISNVTTSAAVVTDGNWHNIVVTFASTSHKTYLDNSLIGTITKTQSNYSATYSYFLGAGFSASWTGVNGYYFNGNIAYASFYNVELTSTQISKNYQSLLNRFT